MDFFNIFIGDTTWKFVLEIFGSMYRNVHHHY